MKNERTAKYIRRLANEGLATLDFFRGLAPSDWQVQIYTAGSGWKVQQILFHLLNAEQAFHHLITDITRGGEGAPANMDLDAFNEQQVRGAFNYDPDTLIRQFSDARLNTIELLRTLSDEDLMRTGRHPFLGITTVEKMVQLIYRHVMIHQRDIRRALNNGGPVDTQDSSAG
ncbi:MAG: hypothetical protein Kow0077_16390 [Anaerolineae bacterium]